MKSRNRYAVTWREADGHTLRYDIVAFSPEEAAAEALLLAYGAIRPALAPNEVTIHGRTYVVDEWNEAQVYMRLLVDPPSAAECARRARDHARRAVLSLAPFQGKGGAAAEALCRLLGDLGRAADELAALAGKEGST